MGSRQAGSQVGHWRPSLSDRLVGDYAGQWTTKQAGSKAGRDQDKEVEGN